MANPQTNLNALNGFNPLSYLGVNATTPPQIIIKNFAPINTNTNFAIGTIWIDETTEAIYMLVSLAAGVATWAQLGTNAIFPLAVSEGGTGTNSFIAYSVICGGTTTTDPLQSVASLGTTGQLLTSQGAGALPTWTTSTASLTLTGDAGGPITSVGGNFDLLGDGTFIGTAGTAGTITFSGTGLIPSTFHGDAGVATVAGNIFTINGDAGNVSTNAAGNSLTVRVEINPFVATEVDTNILQVNTTTTINGTLTVGTFGAGILTSSSGGVISSSAIPLSIANGGTNATTFTTDGVVYYDGTELTSTAAPTGQQVLGNAGGGVPIWVVPTFSLLDAVSIVAPTASFEISLIYYAHNFNNIVIQFTGLSIDSGGADSILMQLYDATTTAYITTGYQSGYNYSAYNVNTLTNVNGTNGFLLGGNTLFSDTLSGTFYINGLQSLTGQNISGTYSNFSTTTTFGTVGGALQLTDPTSKFKLETVGANNFTAGSIQVFGIS